MKIENGKVVLEDSNKGDIAKLEKTANILKTINTDIKSIIAKLRKADSIVTLEIVDETRLADFRRKLDSEIKSITSDVREFKSDPEMRL